MKGRIIAGGIVLAGVLVLAGTLAYRQHARRRAATELSNEALRPRAFLTLLRMNGLWGLAKEYAHDARGAGPGRSYLEATGDDGARLLLVRGIRLAPPQASRSAVFVFEKNGRISSMTEDAELHLGPGTGGRSVFIVTRADEGEMDRSSVSSIRMVGKKPWEALRIRGPFALDTQDGPVSFHGWREPRGAVDDLHATDGLPRFGYDPGVACFRGPPGGPAEPWEVIREHSPLFRP